MSEEFRLVSVQDLLTQKGVEVGDSVRLQGWVRTRRDPQAGWSFVLIRRWVGGGVLGGVSLEVGGHE